MTRRLPSACECEAEVAVVGADDVLNFRQMRCGVQPDHRAVPVEVLETQR